MLLEGGDTWIITSTNLQGSGFLASMITSFLLNYGELAMAEFLYSLEMHCCDQLSIQSSKELQRELAFRYFLSYYISQT